MGHSPIYNVLLSRLARATRSDKPLIVYAGDTNGIAVAERAAFTPFRLLAKQAVLGRTFTTSLDLGLSNRLAHRLFGIQRGLEIPFVPVDFPPILEPVVPEPLCALASTLPRPRLLVVARLVECKNLIALLEAFLSATHDGMAGSLTIVGEGPERTRLAALTSQSSGRAILAGALPFRSCRRLFGAFDGMILPSTDEPWGIVVTESLGWGVPVLSSRQCGAGVSLALEAGDAVKLCGTTGDAIKSAMMTFVSNLDHHTNAARVAAPAIRRKFGATEVADALIKLAGENTNPAAPVDAH